MRRKRQFYGRLLRSPGRSKGREQIVSALLASVSQQVPDSLYRVVRVIQGKGLPTTSKCPCHIFYIVHRYGTKKIYVGWQVSAAHSALRRLRPDREDQPSVRLLESRPARPANTSPAHQIVHTSLAETRCALAAGTSPRRVPGDHSRFAPV